MSEQVGEKAEEKKEKGIIDDTTVIHAHKFYRIGAWTHTSSSLQQRSLNK